MSEAAVFTTALALAFAAVLAFVLLSGRLPAVWRRRCETGLRVIAVAGYLSLLVWGVVTLRNGAWFWLAVQPVLWIWAAVDFWKARRRKALLEASQPEPAA